MTIKIFICCLFLSLLEVKAIAGDRKGNGADLVSCPERSYLLDFYEGELAQFYWPGNEIELVEFFLQKISAFSPVRTSQYLEQLKTFYQDTKWVEGSELGAVADAGNIKVTIPKECQLVQGVLQKKIIFGFEKRYLINKGEWGRLSTIDKAGVILHELIYRELQSVDSHKIRKFNNWIFKTSLRPIKGSEFYQNLMEAGFEWVYLHGIPMDAQRLIINQDFTRSLSTFAGKPFLIFDQVVHSQKHFVDSYLNGIPKNIQFKGEINFENSIYFFKVCSENENIKCRVSFSFEGRIFQLNNVELENKKTGEIIYNKIIRFNESGEVNEII